MTGLTRVFFDLQAVQATVTRFRVVDVVRSAGGALAIGPLREGLLRSRIGHLPVSVSQHR
jgi:hypothetical protein